MPHLDIGFLIEEVLEQYSLPWYGVHGLSHWGRVLENGLWLAEITGANVEVVVLFAIFHDSRRINEHHDPDHGTRGAKLAATLRGKLFDLPQEEFDLFYEACKLHTDGLTESDITTQVCWDADRLDLGRVGIVPDPRWLCTAAAKQPEVIEWAHERATQESIAEVIREIWEKKWQELDNSSA